MKALPSVARVIRRAASVLHDPDMLVGLWHSPLDRVELIHARQR